MTEGFFNDVIIRGEPPGYVLVDGSLLSWVDAPHSEPLAHSILTLAAGKALADEYGQDFQEGVMDRLPGGEAWEITVGYVRDWVTYRLEGLDRGDD